MERSDGEVTHFVGSKNIGAAHEKNNNQDNQPRSQGISLDWGNSPGIGRSRDPKIPRFRGYFKLT